jgi:hypothetical protein
VGDDSAQEAGALLHGHGYTLFDAADVSASGPGGPPIDRPAWNTLALPAPR